MNQTKPGGGNLPQLYNPENGKYTDEEKNKLFEKELANIVMRYMFGQTNTYHPRYPIYGFHNKEYCELYVKHAIYQANSDLPAEKVKDYLLKPKQKDDKSHFFNVHGYNLSNWEKLLTAILSHTDYSQIEYDQLTEFGLFVTVPTTINSLYSGKKITFFTIWRYDQKDQWMHFVTVDLGKRSIEK